MHLQHAEVCFKHLLMFQCLAPEAMHAQVIDLGQ